MCGDYMVVLIFWYGKFFNDWVNDWMCFWINGKGNFVILGMEDIGVYQLMVYLEQVGKVDKFCFMVFWIVSNFIMQFDGLIVVENLVVESIGVGYVGMRLLLEVVFVVGSIVIDDIVFNWDIYQLIFLGSIDQFFY